MANRNKGVPAARREQILGWLAKEKTLSIRELESRLGVSHMTVHRDLDRLAAQNLIIKVRAGAVLPPTVEKQRLNQDICAMCSRRVAQRSEFIIMGEGKAQISACCPHCGILLLGNSVEETALARDYLYGQMVNVFQAAYVVSSDVRLCCVPTILCFASFSDAEKFSHGFGGDVLDFSTALIHLTISHQHGHR